MDLKRVKKTNGNFKPKDLHLKHVNKKQIPHKVADDDEFDCDF